MLAVRKILVSIFDGVSNGGALREICNLAGRFTGVNLRENGQKKGRKAASFCLVTEEAQATYRRVP
ncbi:hypothetical protein GQG94_004597 [Salmonella enterica]|nr:hypothetical protein [Salmonella enterica subsp. enterica serovar Mbandaka]EEJ1220300.1 hypothetical protein [Salmonella enterica]